MLVGVLTRSKEETTCSILSGASGTRRAGGRAMGRCLRNRTDQRALEFMVRSLTLKGQIVLKWVFGFSHCKGAEFWRISAKSASPPSRALMLHLGACTSVSMSNVFCGWQRQISRWNLFALVVPFLGKMFSRTVFHHKTLLSITCRRMTLRNPAQD